MSEPAPATPTPALVSPESVQATIDNFTALDKAGDKGTMTKLAHRLNKDQPALLRHAAKIKADKGDQVGEAAVFYSTLVWAMFERQFGKQLPRLLPDNLSEASKLIDEELVAAAFGEAPVHERLAPAVKTRQPHIAAKLAELIAEDVKEAAITAETATAILPSTQAVVEAFDAAVAGRRPGQNLAPVVRDAPKVGRNDPCPCGSGKKFKHCCA